MKNRDEVKHLTKEDIIKNGSIFTPIEIVKLVKELAKKYINDNSVIVDFGAGYGAFISEFLDLKGDKIATDIDSKSCELLKTDFPEIKIIEGNALKDIKREDYCSLDKELVVIGNPPYNDVTSQYKKNEKGIFEIDEDIYARDLGISFLRMYGKVDAKYIFVLHPLSYLIKKQNFKSLKEFSDKYKLEKAVIFSSQLFESIKKTNAEFPVVAAFYKQGKMTYEDICNFKFDIYQKEQKFCLNNFCTIDGKVEKYPTKNKKETDLQFYTLRDMNALRRNKSFLTGNCSNGIKVTKDNLYQYAWLDYLKNNFNSDNMFLYGNLSPLYPEVIDEELKKSLIGYVLNENQVVASWFKKYDKDFYNNNINNKYTKEDFLKELPDAIL